MTPRPLNVDWAPEEPVEVGFTLKDAAGVAVGARVSEVGDGVKKWARSRWRSHTPEDVTIPDDAIGVTWDGRIGASPGIAEVWKLLLTNTAPASGDYIAVEQPTPLFLDTYLQPGGEYYFQPDGVSLYIQP